MDSYTSGIEVRYFTKGDGPQVRITICVCPVRSTMPGLFEVGDVDEPFYIADDDLAAPGDENPLFFEFGERTNDVFAACADEAGEVFAGEVDLDGGDGGSDGCGWRGSPGRWRNG